MLCSLWSILIIVIYIIHHRRFILTLFTIPAEQDIYTFHRGTRARFLFALVACVSVDILTQCLMYY